VFDSVTLSATDPNSLIDWLQQNDYKYSVQDKDVIDYYIQRGWVFTAIKIKPSGEQGMSEYYRYNINPMLLTYSAGSLVYPIRLASINAGDRTDMVVYVLSDGKMTFPGASTEYANRIDDKELEEIRERYPAFAGLVGQSRYLTKLRRTFSIMEMDSDIEIIPASDSTEFKEIMYYGISPLMDLFPLGLVATFFLIYRTVRERRRNALERIPSSKI